MTRGRQPVPTRASDPTPAFRAALARHAAGQAAQAMADLEALLARAPAFAPARNALGALRLDAGRVAEALAVLEPLAREAPEVASVQVNLGNALVAAGRVDDAVAAFRRALAREPRVAGNHYALGRAFQLAGDPASAIDAYANALRLDPAHVDARANLASALSFTDRFADGAAAARAAIARAPAHAGAHFNLGVALLSQGQWAEGWREFEWRTRTSLLGGRGAPSEAPVWDGRARAGGTLLVYAEQGFGDTLQFVRYLALVRALGLRVVLLCQRPLVRLLHANRVADVVLPGGAALPPHDWQVSLSSLAHVLQLHDDAQVVAGRGPYLRAPARPAPVRGAGAPSPVPSRRRIGLVWAGHPTHVNDRHRSVGLDAFAPLLARPDIEWISLQAGPRAADRDALPASRAMADGTGGGRDFAETAATIDTLEAVVTVDSAVAHLAGAMGVPVWVLLPRIGLDWRWTVGGLPADGATSPWYASLRTLRQRTVNRWDDVLLALDRALAAASAGRAVA